MATLPEHMRELLLSNGGQVAESPATATTTHLVVDENNVELLPPSLEVGKYGQYGGGGLFQKA